MGGIQNSQTTYTSGTVNLSVNGGLLTIRSTTGNAFQFSVSQSVQAETQTAISGIANSQTTYTSGTVSLSELGAITIRSTTGNQYQFSVAAQSVQPETQTFVAGIQNSETTYTSGSVKLSVVGGNMTIRSTTGQAFQFSVSQSVQAETQTFLGGLVGSNATYTSGTVTITGVGGGVTVSSNTGQRIDISVAAQSAQTGISGIANSQTTYTSGTVSLSELGAITIRSTTGNQYQFSVNSQTNQSAIKAFGASNTGNTAGNTGVSTGIDWVLAGSTNITVSQSTAVGGPNTLWLSVPNVGAGAFSGGVSNAGNTAGSTGVTGTRLVFAGTNMVSLSQSTDANGGTITFNATQSNQSAIKGLGVSNTGNTLGNTGISTGQDFIFAATGGITASESTGAATNTIWFSAPATSSIVGSSGISISTNGSTMTIYRIPGSQFDVNGWGMYSSSSSAISQNTNVTVVRFIVDDIVSFSRVDLPMVVSLATAGNTNAAAHSIRKVMNLYTRNGSTLNAITGTSQTEVISWASNTGVYSSLTGPRLLSFPLATAMTPGEYYLGYYISTVTFSSVGGANSTSLDGTYGPLFVTGPQTATMWGQLNAATAQTSSPVSFMQGVQSVSLSATNQTLQASNITQSGTAAARAMPTLFFRNN